MTNISNPVSGIFCFDTPLLRVRRMAASDQTLYWQLYGSKEVMQWIAEPLTDTQLNNSFAAALKLNRGALSELAAGSRLFMVIAARPAETTVGLMAVTFTAGDTTADSATVTAEVGIMLLPAVQHKKLAHEALAGLFRTLTQLSAVNNSVCNIICNIASGNLAAKKLVTGLGFVYCENSNYYKLQK